MVALVSRPPDRSALLDRLSRHRIFRFASTADLDRLVATARPRSLPPRTRLFAVGDTGSAFYVVISGWVKLARAGPSGRDVILEVAGAGTLFGEISVLSRLPRAADATAVVATRLLAVDGRALLETLRQNPDAALEMIRMLAERLAHTTLQMEDSLFLPTDKRLARVLVQLATPDARSHHGGASIDLGLSQKELGEITGMSRESTNKQLALWREAGLVRLEGRTVTLVDAAAFASLADTVCEHDSAA